MNAHNEQQGFTAGDIADQGARQFEAGYAAAKAELHAAAQEAVALAQRYRDMQGLPFGIPPEELSDWAAEAAAVLAAPVTAAQEAVANITAVNGRGVEIEWISGAAKIGAKLYAAPVAAAPACPACEGRPSGENIPCAICKGSPAAPADLIERCREIIAWQETGFLAGDSLRKFAYSRWPDRHESLQLAEEETAREACRVVVGSAPAAPGIDRCSLLDIVAWWNSYTGPVDEALGEVIRRIRALIDASPTGATFHNDGNSEAQFIADEARLNCPPCGGSGHVEDSPKAGEAWQPIETAPKDARWLMLGIAGRNEIMIGYWHNMFRAWWGQTCANGEFKQWQRATHWMPMPNAPKQAGDAEVQP